jgi:Outer membrane protein beta-barrel domain
MSWPEVNCPKDVVDVVTSISCCQFCQFVSLSRPPKLLSGNQDLRLRGDKMRRRQTWLAVCMILGVGTALGQNIELTGSIGRQWNGGLDLSTTLFHRIDVKNGLAFGLGAGYLLGNRYAVEFMWAYDKADAVAQPAGGGADRKLFMLDTNQYFGNVLFHFAGRGKWVRPFLLIGAGATNLHPGRVGVDGTTRLAGDLGVGVKYNFSRRLGLRLQAKWSPAYIATTRAGYWCDPFWGGCWAVGNDHFLNEFDTTAGVTLRF